MTAHDEWNALTPSNDITTPHKVNPPSGNFPNTQRLYRFTNGYGASVVQGPYTYGGNEGYWEVAVVGPDGDLDYTTPITTDVVGWCGPEDVTRLLEDIRALPRKGSPEHLQYQERRAARLAVEEAITAVRIVLDKRPHLAGTAVEQALKDLCAESGMLA